MRNFIEFRRYRNLLTSMQISTVRLKHSFTLYLPKYVSYHSKTLFTSLCNNIVAEQEHHPCRLESIKTFSTTSSLTKSKDRGKDKKKISNPQHINIHEMKEVVDVEKLTTQLDKVIEKLQENFVKNVSLRTATGSLEELMVPFDGEQYLLQELVQISRTPKLVTLNASAFPQVIPDIMEVLAKSQMNLNPQQDGTMIYIPIPKVTKEYRESLAKSAKSFFIKCRDDIKDVRTRQIKKLKNIEKLPEDVCFRVQGYIEIFTNQYIAKAEKLLENKQKELTGT